MPDYARVSVSYGFTKHRTKKTGFSQLFLAETKKANEYLNFTKADLAKINKEQQFLAINLNLLSNLELVQNKLSEHCVNPELFSSFCGGFKQGLNQHQSLFKEHFKNPELFYLFSAGERFKTGLSLHSSLFSFHLVNPDLHSSKCAKLREGRGELWRLKRCKLIKWAFFKEKPKPPINLVCPIRPPSSKLPLPLFTEKQILDSRYLPLPLDCWNYPLIENPPQPKPNREIKENNAMILENSAEFKINGKIINALSCSLSTSDSSFCWQVNLSIFYEDYLNIEMDENKPKLEVNINGYNWVFLLEEVKTVRRFNSYTVEFTGRSPTAELGADYASRLSGFFPSQLYARQIAENLLEFSAFTVKDWLASDYLIPALSLDLSDKSPLAVISELASAGAGFIETEMSGYNLIIKPRYPAKGWEIAETAANVSLPTSHITELGTERLVNPEFNAVRIAGNQKGLLVYRQEQDRSKEAPIVQSPLFTEELPQMREKGIEILSDSGKHQRQEIKTFLSHKEDKAEDATPLAELGEIWEIKNEGIKGIVRSINLNLSLENEALKIEQSLSIDEFLGD